MLLKNGCGTILLDGGRSRNLNALSLRISYDAALIEIYMDGVTDDFEYPHFGLG